MTPDRVLFATFALSVFGGAAIAAAIIRQLAQTAALPRSASTSRTLQG